MEQKAYGATNVLPSGTEHITEPSVDWLWQRQREAITSDAPRVTCVLVCGGYRKSGSPPDIMERGELLSRRNTRCSSTPRRHPSPIHPILCRGRRLSAEPTMTRTTAEARLVTVHGDVDARPDGPGPNDLAKLSSYGAVPRAQCRSSVDETVYLDELQSYATPINAKLSLRGSGNPSHVHSRIICGRHLPSSGRQPRWSPRSSEG
ncbi:hypothetical protein K3495_g2560 [Podosphaera aphanis]|nr:hypothetical protein K3495_g2560 [Podosphaera aphanis]